MFVRKYLLWGLVIWFTIGGLGGCVSPEVGAPPPVSPLATPEASVSTLPGPTAAVVAPSPTSSQGPLAGTPEPGKGGVSGKLTRFDGTLLKGIIGYGALIEMRGGMRLASVDPLVDKRFITDVEGRFRLDNLPPGEYVLAMQSPVGIIMPHNTTGQIVKFAITADEETKLGQLAVGYIYPDSP